MYPRTEMLDLVVIDGRARGIVARDLVTGKIESHVADAVVLGTGGYGNVFYLSTNAKGSNATAIWRALQARSGLRQPCYTQIHPDLHSGERRVSVEADADERVAAERRPRLGARSARATSASPSGDSGGGARLLPGAPVSRASATSRRATSPRAPPRQVCDEGRGVGPGGLGVYLDFADAIERLGEQTIRERYGNLFEMYERITGENPYQVPMRIYPAVHYTMGGLWVDYNLMSTIPGLHVIGEANFSDHGANRLGASALMQGLADGYFVLPYTIGDYLASTRAREGRGDAPAVPPGRGRGRGAHARGCSTIKGTRTVDSFHRELGKLMWENCGMARNAAGLKKALERIPALREEFWQQRQCPGQRRRAQPVARKGRPGRGLPRARRADVPRCPAPRRVVRRPLPRGVPDRQTAKRGATTSDSLRRRVGVSRGGPSSRD